MVGDAFTIRILVPDGDPEGVRVVDRLTSTGLTIAFPREHWPRIKTQRELGTGGVYILVGYAADDDLPTLYIGQADPTRDRIDSHFSKKDFWNWGIVFCSKAGDAGLSRTHITWLEHALIKRALEARRSHLENGNTPQEPGGLSASDKADVAVFLKEILQTLPLVGLRALEVPMAVATPMAESAATPTSGRKRDDTDTIIVPAQKEGFDRVFLGESAWWAIRIAGGMLPKIKFIAAYQTRPVMAVTHVAPVARIEPYGEDGKYKVIFSEPAREIGPIPFADAPSGSMQGPRYTTHAKLLAARTVRDLI